MDAPFGLNPFADDFTEQLLAAQADKAAAAHNTTALKDYEAAVANWMPAAIQARDNGNPIPPAPALPEVWRPENGRIVKAPWPGIQPATLPPQKIAVSSPLRAEVPAPDRLDQIIAMLRVMKADLDAIKGK